MCLCSRDNVYCGTDLLDELSSGKKKGFPRTLEVRYDGGESLRRTYLFHCDGDVTSGLRRNRGERGEWCRGRRLHYQWEQDTMAAPNQASFFVHEECSVRDVAAKVVEEQEEDNSFFICDLFELKNMLELWHQQLPKVTPYFAIKSCSDRIVIRTLAMEGVNFDCSNKREIQAVLSAGVHSSRIIYANPAKQSSHLDFAESSGVTLMTFDCLEELQKIKDKNARLLLRFSPQAGDHEDRMARKYGCSILEAEHILRVATDQGHTVVGIAFHIGGRHFSTESYRSAIEKARRLFDIGAQMGIKMTVLDIGGGFVGSTRRRDLFIKVCETVRSALDEHFPSTGGIHFIAEPGQYMVTSSFTLAVKVVAKRTRQTNVDGEFLPYHDVYINDSKQNCIPRENYEGLCIKYHPLSPPLERPCNQITTLWGATCHPMDKFEDHVPFFKVSVGEWLLMDNVGAYGLVKACGFNGTGFPPVHYRTSAEDAARVCSIIEESQLLPGYSQPQSLLRVGTRTEQQL